MNRRGFFSSLASLAGSALLPAVPSISVAQFDAQRFILTVAMNSIYGKFGARSVDHRSAYPYALEDLRRARAAWKVATNARQ
jgi:hypothetical protein